MRKNITDHDHDKFSTIQEINKLKAENVAARLTQANLASKYDIADFIKKTDFDDNYKKIIILNKTLKSK